MRDGDRGATRCYGAASRGARESILIGRVSVPDDVARIAAFLASDEGVLCHDRRVDQPLRRPLDGLAARIRSVALASTVRIVPVMPRRSSA